jgi:tetratricopeptide (TPR) repeat protein
MMAGWPVRWILVPGLLIVLAATALDGVDTRPAQSRAAAIAIDYPQEGSIFPPEITPPTFLWRDAAKGVTLWRIDVSFGDGAAAIHTTSQGERPRIGKIDPDCVADTNAPPRLTPEMAAAHSWTPDPAAWQAIKRHSVARPATVAVTGVRLDAPDQAVSRGKVTLSTSKDPVGAPIFYRDVPLMPSELEKGVIKPLAAEAIPLVAWRVRNVGEPRSRVVMEDLPLCANCHSFSADGKTMGMDLDGLHGNRGMYILAPVTPEVTVRQQEVIQWSSPAGKLKGNVRVGFMSQVSPDGRYVATTVNPASMAAPSQAPPSNYYVANFKDYRFLQVFYPTRGILCWYSRQTGVLEPLPGADDLQYVQMGAVWSPDGESLVFAHAAARDPNPPGVPLAQFANDPNELQLKYDLYRIPFHNGLGGTAEPIAGASANGMSNTFPKVSPDGRWIVFVQCRNGQLMRPDSQLYIVPAAGGQARRMRCNTSRMNSWHSFSPNGRWLVFSSKSRSPYTQMYLTHLDSDGNDSPPILIDNATASNRAVNIPEFVNVTPDGLRQIGGPVLDYYRLYNSAAYLQRTRRYRESAEKWKKVVELDPDDELAQRNLGTVLLLTGQRAESGAHFRKASELKLRAALEADPNSAGSARAHYDLGMLLSQRGDPQGAIEEWREALALDPKYAEAHRSLGDALYSQGRTAEALAHWRDTIQLHPNDAAALERAAWVLATWREAAVRNGDEALGFALRAVEISGGKDARMLDALAAAYAEKGQFADAVPTARRAQALAAQQKQPTLADEIAKRIALYEAGRPFRE